MASPTAQPNSPAEEYAVRLSRHEAAARALQRRHEWMGYARLAVFLLTAALVWKIVRDGSPSFYWLLAPVAAFVFLGVWHRRILQAKDRAQRAVAMYQRGQARMEDRWIGQGETGEQFADPHHLYADDLDILGKGSLFQLLCVARSRMGKECLAQWLLQPAGREEILERQAAVRELAGKTDLREDLALAGESDAINADPAKLLRWVATAVDLDYGRWWPWALALAALSVSALSYALTTLALRGSALWTPFLLTLIINGSVMYVLRHRLEQLLNGLDQASHNLDSLADFLRRLEAEAFSSPRLRALQQALFLSGLKASECIARLDTVTDLADSRHNMMVRLIDLPVMYSVQVALALQRWRAKYGANVARWVQTVGEMEALISVATYSYEHPQDVFPEFSAAQQPAGLHGAEFHGRALGHPLLPAEKCVRNDVALGSASQILLVSGSNMSGKSTLLRVVGINTVLAMAGAPVRAQSLHLSPLAVGASMRVSDSLQQGVSHFYAEIQRIRQVVELSSQGPSLFLFDEILQGTNSHDRKIGAQGVLHTLLENGALGLVTTHDLALTELAEKFPDKMVNVHFQEKLAAGKLSFDYLLRPGVVTTSNGLELMKSIGLEVGE
ncbi:MAG: mismatch repair protein [Acidobacteriia bacterium]|nr:mismatch repair protein [Terriglobia bacterium]